MTLKGVRSRSASLVAAAGALSLLLGATALLVAPSANADQTTVAGGHGNGHGNGNGDPAGNNGTIKIEGVELQSNQPDNNPHQGCAFTVEFYNYDKNDSYKATVTFEDQKPTADAGLEVVSGNLTPFIGEDAAGGGTDLDAREQYTLKFTGQPHPKQGYHVKLTVNAPGSIGNDVKHKVFWVEGCDATPPTPPTTPPTTTDTPPATTDTPPATSDTPPATTDTPPATTDTPPATTNTPPATSTTSPATTSASTPGYSTGTPSDTPVATASTPASDVPGESQSPTAGVPTEVDAGFGGPGAANSVAGSNSPFGLAGGLLLAAGGLMLAVRAPWHSGDVGSTAPDVGPA
ncbi:hypothetical protein [Kribbella sp. NPDC004875]|uniref:hypothetical protein n=1 Tax=Kribbella sp. NPDC004875 TaxID=3364107 RepID=UPI00368C2608